MFLGGETRIIRGLAIGAYTTPLAAIYLLVVVASAPALDGA